jgi:thioredoxin-like negative regulator of GroEL
MSESGELVNLKTATEANWNEVVVQSELPVAVNFFGPACEHSQKLTPVFASLSHRYINKMRFAKVDAAAERGLATRYGVQSTPTLLFFASGRPYFMVIGEAPKHQFESELDHILAQHKRCMARSSAL